jgi:DNA-binding CsgD family transcriptional regulator
VPGGLLAAIAHRAANFFKFRDDLRLRNIRWELWPLLLVFPLSFIKGDLRYFDLKIAIAGYQCWELMLLSLGIGWLILALTPKRFILPLLRIAAVLSAALFSLQIFMPFGQYRLEVFIAFQFFIGICAAAAFYLFCFELNNIERLFGMVIIQLYYGSFYIAALAFPAFQAAGETWGGIAVTAVYLVVVFACRQKHEGLERKAAPGPPHRQGSGGAAFAIGLNVVYYVIVCVTNRIKWTENSLSSMAFGIGTFASIILIITIQLLLNRSALYVWLLFLVLSLSALGVLMFETPATRLSGSFAYGLGDGLGYIIIYYLCGGAIKKSKSLKMFRLCCAVFFIEYFGISGIFSHAFDSFAWPNHYLAFGIVLILCSVCFLLIPLTQKKLFRKDWTDGIQLQDIAGYTGLTAETVAINIKDRLNLTDREHEVFTLLLKNVSPKEIAGTLNVSYHAVNFHRTNLYRKLGIQSRAELFARYLSVLNEKSG